MSQGKKSVAALWTLVPLSLSVRTARPAATSGHQAEASPGQHSLASLLLAIFFLGLAALPETAAQGQVAVVRYTPAQEYKLRRTLTLPGSVEARTASLVASEVEGLVVEFPVKEGDRVGQGDVLARLRTTDLELRLEAAQASLQEATARLKLAERNLERARDLFESQIFSQQQLDDQLYEYNAWQGRCQQLAAEIARIKHDIERATIRAPFAGAVVREHTEVGEWMPEGGAVVELLALDELEVRVEVPERYFRNLKVGSSARVSFEALPGFEVRGRVSAVIPRADPQARTFPLKVRIRNRQGRIGVGMLARVAFVAGQVYAATVVPKDAIVTRGGEKFVYVVSGNSTVNLVPVQTGASVGAWTEVIGSVRPGQRVVTRGNERLVPGQPVEGELLNYELP